VWAPSERCDDKAEYHCIKRKLLSNVNKPKLKSKRKSILYIRSAIIYGTISCILRHFIINPKDVVQSTRAWCGNQLNRWKACQIILKNTRLSHAHTNRFVQIGHRSQSWRHKKRFKIFKKNTHRDGHLQEDAMQTPDKDHAFPYILGISSTVNRKFNVVWIETNDVHETSHFLIEYYLFIC